MAGMTITNARAVLGGKIQECNLRLDEGRIQGVLPAGDAYGKTLDAKGRLVIPGFIDIHTHGGGNVDFNNAEARDVRTARDFFASQGVTTFLPTILTDSEETMLRSVTAVAKARQELGCTQVGGIHLEGPFLAASHKGAMPEALLQAPSYPLFRRLQEASGGLVRRITLSPELEGAAELTKRLTAEGVRVSLGHSGASYEQTLACIQAGAVSATHLFNAMAPIDRHQPGVITAALEQDIFCEAICDGRHLHPAIVRLILQCKGPERFVAVTDSIMATGLGDGLYKLGVNTVAVRGEDATIMGTGTRAGSVLTAIGALRHLMDFTGLPVERCVPFLTENPARLLGIYSHKGSLDVGRDADLVFLDKNLQVRLTMSQGNVIFEAN